MTPSSRIECLRLWLANRLLSYLARARDANVCAWLAEQEAPGTLYAATARLAARAATLKADIAQVLLERLISEETRAV